MQAWEVEGIRQRTVLISNGWGGDSFEHLSEGILIYLL